MWQTLEAKIAGYKTPVEQTQKVGRSLMSLVSGDDKDNVAKCIDDIQERYNKLKVKNYRLHLNMYICFKLRCYCSFPLC